MHVADFTPAAAVSLVVAALRFADGVQYVTVAVALGTAIGGLYVGTRFGLLKALRESNAALTKLLEDEKLISADLRQRNHELAERPDVSTIAVAVDRLAVATESLQASLVLHNEQATERHRVLLEEIRETFRRDPAARTRATDP